MIICCCIRKKGNVETNKNHCNHIKNEMENYVLFSFLFGLHEKFRGGWA